MAVNLVAPVVLLQALLPGMRAARHGRVVNIGSRAALGKPGRTAYGASKGALAAMTRTWALELAADGITVNTVAPGPVATELFNASNPRRSAHARAGAAIPVGRSGLPEEVAHVVAMFMDRRAAFVTGQLIHVCGGVSVGRGRAAMPPAGKRGGPVSPSAPGAFPFPSSTSCRSPARRRRARAAACAALPWAPRRNAR